MNAFSRTAALVAATFALSATASNDDAKLAEIRTKVDEMFPGIEGELVHFSPMQGWVTIQKGSIVAYMSEDGRYLMQGDLIDLEQNVNLSENSRNHVRRELVGAMGDNEVILFSPSEVRHSVTIFTDIDCTYCRRLHAQIDEYLENGIEVRYLLYPRNGPASRSWITSEDVWCASDRHGALTAAKLDRDFDSHKCDATAITQHYSLGQEIGLTGTPAIVLEDGTLLSGWLPPDALRQRLDSLFSGD